MFAALARLPPPYGGPVDAADAIDVEFIRRTAPARLPMPGAESARVARGTQPRAGAIETTASSDAGDAGAARSVAPAASAIEGPHAPRPLDLSLPPAAHEARTRRAFERAFSIDVRPTRFERHWVPDGNALEQASFRSPVVAAALGLFGGPPRRCSEVERRLRRADCLPLRGQEAEDEALLRRLDEASAR
ncbi:MAG: hypothetical protein ACOY37_07365 [Pseudomonadota bacterium]